MTYRFVTAVVGTALVLLSASPSRSAVFPGRGKTTSTGNHRALYMAIRPSTGPALSQASLDAIRASETVTREFYAEASGGKLDFRYVDVVDVPIQLVTNPQDNQLHRPNDWWGAAENYVRNTLGLEPESYDLNLFDVSATPQDIGQGWSGVATFPGNNLAMQVAPGPGWGQLVVDHELGHRFGAPHSSAWRLSDNGGFNPYVWDSRSGAYAQYSASRHGLEPLAYGVELDEYGDPLSVMGNISHEPFSVHQKLTNFHWLSESQAPSLNVLGEGVHRVYAHDELQATLNAQANVMGVVGSYNPNSLYGLTFTRADQVYNKDIGAFQTQTVTFTLEYRSEYESVFMYMNDGLLDLDLTGGADRNHRERGLQVGEKFEDLFVSPSYFVGTGVNNEWAGLDAPPPTPDHVLRPEWYEFRILDGGSDAIGSYVSIAVDLVAYVPLGDLNDDGFFDGLDIEKFVANWMTDTRPLNSVAQQMLGDINNSGLVDLTDAFLLREILIGHGGSGIQEINSIPEPGAASFLASLLLLHSYRRCDTLHSRTA